MAYIGLLFIAFIIIGLIQWFLSSSKHVFLGKIIPVSNFILAVVMGVQCSDYFVGYFVLFTMLVPTLIWLVIDDVVQKRKMVKVSDNLNKMTIRDL